MTDINRVFALQAMKSNPHMVAILNEMLEALKLAQTAISEELAAGGDDEHPMFIKHRKALNKVTAAIKVVA